ncbi:MAG: hypothetical protein MRJ96_05410 [Nitrospirales bacterium]|nr:hypothetical protein [Nitrospira sp.]MDR4500872.1 hypothetical protein [Nitrospirales bacterium]
MLNRRNIYAILLSLSTSYLIATSVYADASDPIRRCSYEQKIHSLSKTLKNSEGSQDRAETITKRIQYIEEMNRLDANTQFKFCSDESGKASLKFNTPEEKWRDRIETLFSLLKVLDRKAVAHGSLQGVGDSIKEQIKKAKEKLADLREFKKRAIDKYETATHSKTGNLDELFQEYQQLRKERQDAMNNLSHLADRWLCLGATAEDMELARLFHETIPQDSSCNPLLRVNLLDRIRTSGGSLINRALLEKETYERVKMACPNLGPLGATGSWHTKHVQTQSTKYPQGHVWYVAVSPTSLEKTIEKNFRDGSKEKVHAKVTATQGPPSKLNIGRPATGEVNFVVEGEISGFIKKMSAEGMSNDLRCINCEFKLLGGYQQVHPRTGRYCNPTGKKERWNPSQSFSSRIAIGSLNFCRRKFRYEIQVVATSKMKSPEIHLKGPSLSEIMWTYDQRD